ncbi:MAG: hypothetical protein FWG10_09240 [Eubacteriaceae bacterium]|nr:hypothetical protein [Eubacteriaceae bacterium]
MINYKKATAIFLGVLVAICAFTGCKGGGANGNGGTTQEEFSIKSLEAAIDDNLAAGLAGVEPVAELIEAHEGAISDEAYMMFSYYLDIVAYETTMDVFEGTAEEPEDLGVFFAPSYPEGTYEVVVDEAYLASFFRGHASEAAEDYGKLIGSNAFIASYSDLSKLILEWEAFEAKNPEFMALEKSVGSAMSKKGKGKWEYFDFGEARSMSLLKLYLIGNELSPLTDDETGTKLREDLRLSYEADLENATWKASSYFGILDEVYKIWSDAEFKNSSGRTDEITGVFPK